jgi:hypothetical protein
MEKKGMAGRGGEGGSGELKAGEARRGGGGTARDGVEVLIRSGPAFFSLIPLLLSRYLSVCSHQLRVYSLSGRGGEAEGNISVGQGEAKAAEAMARAIPKRRSPWTRLSR